MNQFAQQTPPTWQAERHRRGMQRYYPFDALLSNGQASAGSNAILAAPVVNLQTGAATVTPQNRAREMVERKSAVLDTWAGSDSLNYWGRRHYMEAWVGIGAGNVTPAGARLYAGIYLQSPFSGGLGPFPLNPITPLVMLRYVRDGNLDPSADERYELCTGVGDGSAAVITRLTGILGPRTDFTGNPWTQRLEMFYDPGVGVYAYVDGVLGAVNTTGLPNVASVPLGSAFMAGFGTYLEAAQIGDNAQAVFTNALIESYRP